jgi:hypothetical protein
MGECQGKETTQHNRNPKTHKAYPQTPVRNCAGKNVANITVSVYKVVSILRFSYFSASLSVDSQRAMRCFTSCCDGIENCEIPLQMRNLCNRYVSLFARTSS